MARESNALPEVVRLGSVRASRSCDPELCEAWREQVQDLSKQLAKAQAAAQAKQNAAAAAAAEVHRLTQALEAEKRHSEEVRREHASTRVQLELRHARELRDAEHLSRGWY